MAFPLIGAMVPETGVSDHALPSPATEPPPRQVVREDRLRGRHRQAVGVSDQHGAPGVTARAASPGATRQQGRQNDPRRGPPHP